MNQINEKNDKIRDLISPIIEEDGYRLVLGNFRGDTLQLLLERIDNVPITLDECVQIARELSPILDENNICSNSCGMEVSSAGIDRPLVVLEDFEKFIGHKARVDFLEPVNKKRKITGVIISVEDDGLTFETRKESFTTDFYNIKSAKLVITDELIAFQRSLIPVVELPDDSLDDSCDDSCE